MGAVHKGFLQCQESGRKFRANGFHCRRAEVSSAPSGESRTNGPRGQAVDARATCLAEGAATVPTSNVLTGVFGESRLSEPKDYFVRVVLLNPDPRLHRRPIVRLNESFLKGGTETPVLPFHQTYRPKC